VMRHYSYRAVRKGTASTTPSPMQQQSIATRMSVCPSACLCFSLLVDSHKSETAYDQTSPNFRRMLIVAVFESFSGGVWVHYAFHASRCHMWLALPSGRQHPRNVNVLFQAFCGGNPRPHKKTHSFPKLLPNCML